jgi:uncharacterized membrane protein YjgN (DUF898 family)
MAPGETILAAALVIFTVGVAAVFGWRQFRQLRRANPSADSADRQFTIRSSRRRLVISVMLAIVGLLIGATYLTGLDRSVLAIGDQLDNAAERPPLTDAQLRVVRIYGAMWIGILVLLLGIVIGVGIDLYSMRRHFRQSHNRILADRRAMMERQLALMRAEHRDANFNPEWN